MSKRICPRCGSENTDFPRTYDTRQPAIRFVHCGPVCLDCGHEGEKYDSISAGSNAWRAPHPTPDVTEKDRRDDPR